MDRWSMSRRNGRLVARACRWAASFQFLALVLLTDLTYYYFFRLYRSGMLDNQRQRRFQAQVAALEPVPPRKSGSEYTVVNREHERLLFSLGAAGEAVYSVGQN